MERKNSRGLPSTLRQSLGSSLRKSCPSAGFQLNQKFFARSSSRCSVGGMLGETCSANTLLDMTNPFGCEWIGSAGVPYRRLPLSQTILRSGSLNRHRRDRAADGEDRDRGVEQQLTHRAFGRSSDGQKRP